MFAAVGVTIAQDIVLQRFGVASPIYSYVYYYSDSLLTISLFFVIMSFYQQVFQQMGVGRYVRGASVLLLSATAVFSYLVVRQNTSHLTSRFVVELGQNLYFVGVILTYLLWGAIVKLRETRTRLIQLVLALGIFFSADAGAYAMRNLFPGLQVSFLRFVPPLVGLFLPLAWAYTFTKISEDARLETARVAAPRMAAHQHS
ncbi:MAG: hypothetical protein ACYDCD_01840 [Candidatus Acidiferrales bacterium]